MSETPKFVNSFWTKDFTSTEGFDVLHQRMKDAKAFTDDVTKFLRERAAIEETYAKSLMKLAKSTGGNADLGSLGFSWEKIKDEHQNLSAQIVSEVEKPIKDMREAQRLLRKKLEDTLKRSQKDKAKRYADNEKAKKFYESKCREAERAEEESNKSASLPQKDIDKLKTKARKAKTAAASADSAYHDAVRLLDQARIMWEKEMETCCNYFQEMEEKRIDLIRRKLWALTNLVATAFVADDDHLENMRISLENCSISQDIQNFISTNKIGCERPAPIEYQGFYQAGASMRPRSLANSGPSSDTTYVTVLFDYKAQGDLELSLKTGEKLRLIEKENDTWWRGEKNGKEGVFPAQFVKLG
eukprot:gene11305-3342_t